jgi:hypothetical protein
LDVSGDRQTASGGAEQDGAHRTAAPRRCTSTVAK